MSWHEVDFLLLDTTAFKREIKDVISVAYYASHKILMEAYDSDRRELASAVYDDDEEVNQGIRWQSENHREIQFEDELRMVATMVLAGLASSIDRMLRGLKEWFDKTHPPLSAGYPGRSSLEKLVTEYRERFGISLEGFETFRDIQEITLARNSLIHSDGNIRDPNYEQLGPTLTDDSGRVNLGVAEFEKLVVAINQFADELLRSLQALTKRAKS